MGVSKEVYQACVDILHEELRPAMGCTEPIAVAYAGALANHTVISSMAMESLSRE